MFVERMTQAADDTRVLGSGHNLAHALQLGTLSASSQLRVLFAAAAGMAFVVTVFPRLATFTIVAVVGATYLVIRGEWQPLAYEHEQGLLFAAIALGTVVGSVLINRRRLGEIARDRATPYIVALVLLPYAFAFGTNNPMWFAMAIAGCSWSFAATLFLLRSKGSGSREEVIRVIGLAIASVLVAAALLRSSSAMPYRQSSRISDMRETVTLQGSTLRVSDSLAATIRDLQRGARTAGFRDRTPVIDLTGRSPGLLYAIVARPLGSAWIPGAYPGDDAHAERVIEREPRGRARASWVLTEADGHRAIDASVLRVIGRDLATDYTVVATALSDAGKELQLWRPRRP
jgi:hypothetical protein